MKINLDTIVQAVSPAPIEFTLGGKDYFVREVSLGELLYLENLKSSDEAESAEFLKSLMVGDTPPVLDELVKVSARLHEIRDYIAKDKPDLLKSEPKTPNRTINFADAVSAYGIELPAPISDFRDIESAYVQAVNKFGIITSAILAIVMETTPKKVKAVAIAMIRRQVQDQTTASAESPESALPSQS